MSRKQSSIGLILMTAIDAILCLPSSAMGQPDRPPDYKACKDTYTEAHDHLVAGQFIEARELMMKCAEPSCGLLLSRECAVQYSQLDSDIPSIVPVVTDKSGMPRLDVEVRIDGELVATKLDGRAVPVNPGMHEITFAENDEEFAVRKLLLVQGQRNQVVSVSQPSRARKVSALLVGQSTTEDEDAPHASVTFDRPTEKDHVSSSGSDRTDKILKYSLAGVGVAGLAGYGLLTYWGRKDNSMLSQCSPYCRPDSVDHVHKMYLAADISLGVGVAAVVADIWLIAAGRSTPEHEAPQTALKFGLQPTPSGAVATAWRSF